MYLFQLSGLAKNEKIRYICELMFKTLEIPVCFLDRNGDIVYEYSERNICHPVYLDKKEMFCELFYHDKTDGIPVFTTTRYFENYFSIDVLREKSLMGIIVVGPSITSEMDRETIHIVFRDTEMPVKLKLELVEYYRFLPVIDYKKLMNASMLLYYMIYNKELDSTIVIERNAHLKNVYEKIKNTIEFRAAQKRKANIFHHSPAYEKYFLQYVREGNMEKLKDHLSKPVDGEAGMLSKNPLRNQKNLFICSTAIITRAAIEGGLSSELAFTISDSYIQHVEELTEIDEVISLYYKMLFDFTERVHLLKKQNYSKLVIQCINYIFKNLYEDISLSQLAETTGVSCNYISEIFKKEVGIPVSKYIQRERVEEAKKMLVMTNDSIMDICTNLSFTDQSYFTKVFKKLTGITPKQYRNLNAKL